MFTKFTVTVTRRTVGIAGATLLLIAGVPLAFAVTASADTERRGSCGGSAWFDYEVEKDDGRFEVNFEVNSNRQGQQWQLRLFHDGSRYYSGVHTTDYEGEVDIDWDRPDTSGNDSFRARARNLSSGEVCSVTIVQR